jgi:hypothetical protein
MKRYSFPQVKKSSIIRQDHGACTLYEAAPTCCCYSMKTYPDMDWRSHKQMFSSTHLQFSMCFNQPIIQSHTIFIAYIINWWIFQETKLWKLKVASWQLTMSHYLIGVQECRGIYLHINGYTWQVISLAKQMNPVFVSPSIAEEGNLKEKTCHWN